MNNEAIDAHAQRTNVDGCEVSSWVRTGAPNQRWTLHGPSDGQTPIHEGSYYVKVEKSNKYWDLSGDENASNKNGTRAQIWDQDGGKDRKLTFEPCDDDLGYYRLKFGNDRYMDVSGPWEWDTADKALEKFGKAPIRKKDNGAKLMCFQHQNNDGQKFKIVHLGNSVFAFKSKISNKAIDVSGGKINDNGPDLQLWNYDSNNPSQRFVLISTKDNQQYKY